VADEGLFRTMREAISADMTVPQSQRQLRYDIPVLIDEYKEIADSFMLGAAMCAESDLGSVDGYRIFKKQA